MSIDIASGSPYYDDYFSADGGLDKNYFKVLFRPGRALQARELTTAQSILQNQISTFGKTNFPEGDSVYGSQRNLDNPFHYAVLSLFRTDGDLIAKSITGDEFLNFKSGDVIIGGTSGVKAIIGFESPAESLTDPNMLFVKYIGSSQTSNGAITIQQSQFLKGESIYFANTATQNTSSELAIISASTELGSGIGVTIDEGIIFTRELFVHTPKQSIIVNKWITNANARIGYVIQNTIKTSATDNSLKDNAQGYPNYTADGADRQQVNLYLASLGYDTDWISNEVEVWSPTLRYHKNKKIKLSSESTEVFVCILDHQSTSGNKPITLTDSIYWIQAINFVEIGRLKNGQWVVPVPNKIGFSRSTYNRLKKWVERRDAQIHGDFTIKPYGLNVKENDINGLKIAYQLGTTLANTSTALLSLDYGHSFKNGHEVVTQTPLNFVTDKPRTKRFINSAINSTPDVDYGNYILVNKVHGYFSIESHETVTFYNANTSTSDWDNVNNIVGTAKIRYFDLDSGRAGVTDSTSSLYPSFRAYLYNFKSVKAGEPRAVKGLKGYANAVVSKTTQTSLITGNINIATANVYSQLIETGAKNKALFELSPKYVQEVSSTNTSDIPVFYTLRDFPAQWVRTSKTIGGVSTYVFELRKPVGNTAFVASDFGAELGNGLIDPANEVDIAEANYTIYNMHSTNSVTVVRDGIHHVYSPGKIIDPEFIIATNAEYKWTSDTIPKLSIYYPTSNTSVNIIQNQYLRVKVGITNAVADTKTYSPVNITKVLDLSSNTHQGYDSTNISFFEPDIYSVDAIYMNPTGNTNLLFPQVNLNISSGTLLNGEKIYEINSAGTKTGVDGCLVSEGTANTWNFIVGSGNLSGNYFTANNYVIGATSGAKALIKSTPILNSGAKDITDRYIFDSGQRDNYYEWGKLTLKPGKPKPTGPLLIAYSKFITSYAIPLTKTFFTLNSYGNFANNSGELFIGNSTNGSTRLTYPQLPVYSSSVVGNVKLRDCIDFRPMRHSNTSVTLSSNLSSGTLADIFNTNTNWLVPGYKIINPSPVTKDLFKIDYKHFLDKRVIVGLTSDYKFGVFEGTPGAVSDPIGPSGLTPYWKVYFPPYLDDISLVLKTYLANRNYTMKDIGSLDSRITALENTVSLTVNELQALSTPVPSMSSLYLGLERFKNGLLLDTFIGTNVGNLSDSDYRCSIESSTQTCRAPFTSDVIDLDQYTNLAGVTYHPAGSKSYVNDNGENVIGKDGIITLNYVNIPWQIQTTFSNTISVNPYSVIAFNGKMVLSPSQDNWMDTTTLPTVNVDLTGNSDGWNALTSSVNGILTISFSTIPTFKIGSQVTSIGGGTGTVAEIDGKTIVLTDFEGKFTDGSVLSGVNNSGDVITKTMLTSQTSGGAPGFGTKFGDWQTNWTGVTTNSSSETQALTRTVSVPQTTYTTNTVTGAVTVIVDTVQRVQTGTATTTTTTSNIVTDKSKTGQTTSLTTQVVQTDLGPKVIDVSIVPFIRTNDVLFRVEGLKPNTVHYPFFNGVNVSQYCSKTTLSGNYWILTTYGSELKSDSRGRINGIFKIPGGIFATGERTFRLIDVKNNDLGVTMSHSDANYNASGLAQTIVDQIVSTRTPVIEHSLLTTEKTVTESGSITTTNDTWTTPPVAPDINTTYTPTTPPPNLKKCIHSTSELRNDYSDGTIQWQQDTYSGTTFPYTFTYTLDFGDVTGMCGINYEWFEDIDITLTWGTQTVTRHESAPLIAGRFGQRDFIGINKTMSTPNTITVTAVLHSIPNNGAWNLAFMISKVCPGDFVTPRANDPLAQTFFVDSVESPNGLFVTAIDTYVATTPTDNALPLSLELRTVVNGMPSLYTLPDTEIVYNLIEDISSSSHNTINLLTINTVDEHKLLSGQFITISGDVNYNGTYSINTTTTDGQIDRNKFTISIPWETVNSTQPSSNLAFSKINVASIENNWAPTKFVFEYPIYLQKGEYCFVVKSDTSEYELYISEMGQTDLTTGEIISKQPAIGSMYKSQNANDWTSDQDADLAFIIYRAAFDTVNVGSIEFKQDDLSLNYLAGVKGAFSSDFNVKYNILNFQPATTILPKTAINWGIMTAGLNGAIDSQWSNLTPKTDNEFPETRLITKGTSLLQVKSQLTSTDNFVSPVIDLLNQRAILIENIINNTVAKEYGTSGGAAQAKYISKSIILEKGMDAIDLKVTLEASRQTYNGSDSNILAYMKLLSGADETPFTSRYWYPMSLVSDPGYSNGPTDFRKYEFIPPKNIWYTNDGSGNLTIHYTGDGVIYPAVNSTIDYEESDMHIFMDLNEIMLEWVHYDADSESITITKYDSNIVWGESTTPESLVKVVSFKDFLQYAVKIVMISSNKSMVPLIKKVNAIALT